MLHRDSVRTPWNIAPCSSIRRLGRGTPIGFALGTTSRAEHDRTMAGAASQPTGQIETILKEHGGAAP